MTKINIVALFSGILFSIGLGISGMTKPQKVIGFLDILGEWDMSLIFVMVGGIITYLIFNLFIKIKLKKFLMKFKLPLKVKLTGISYLVQFCLVLVGDLEVTVLVRLLLQLERGVWAHYYSFFQWDWDTFHKILASFA